MRNVLRIPCVALVTLAASGVMVHVNAQQAGAIHAVPDLSQPMQLYYHSHPEAYQKLLDSLPLVSNDAPPAAQTVAGEEPVPGTWAALTNPLSPPRALSNPILLTDGTVIAHVSCTSDWYKFTPSNTGSYINGTWAPIASTSASYGPRFFGSGVLPDGRVVIEGGEYNGSGCGGGRTTQGAIYDPTTNIWTAISPPAGWTTISDAAGIVLPNGTYMQTSCCDFPPHTALLNATTLTWTATGTGKFDIYDEESMALLPDDTVLTADAYVGTGTCGTGSERYSPSTGQWTSAGSTVIQQSDCTGNLSYEVGPLVMRPDGTAVSFSGRTSATPQTAIYNTATHTWSAGPVHPSVAGVPYTMADAPAAVLPNGNVLVAMSPSNWTTSFFPAPTHYFELNTDNTFTPVPDKSDAASWNSFEANFVLLPTGQVMAFSIDGPTVEIYTPGGTYAEAWRPTITSPPSLVAPGQTITLGGTQFNGLTEGAYYGDDTNGSSNFPIVRIKNNATGHVFYARTFNHGSRSIAPGAASSTSVTVPATIETGASTLEVVANGIPSLPVNVTVGTGMTAEMTTPPPGSTFTGTSVNFGWTPGTGVSQYWLYVGTTGVGSYNLYNSSTGTNKSAMVTGLPSNGSTVYVRLWSLISGSWQSNDYTYTAYTLACSPSTMTSPAPGSTFTGTSQTFTWSANPCASQYWLYVGTQGAGSYNIYSSSTGTATTANVTGLPTNGSLVWLRLWSLVGGSWGSTDYTYTAYTLPIGRLQSPSDGAFLTGTSKTFSWTAGTGIAEYWLQVGTSKGGAAIFNASTGTSLSTVVNNLPTASCSAAPAFTNPLAGSTLSGDSVTFNWSNGCSGPAVWVRLWSRIGTTWYSNDYSMNSAGYQLSLGTQPGTNDLLNGAQSTSASASATLLPTNGSTVYASLYYLSAGSWNVLTTTFMASGMVSGFTEAFKTPGHPSGWQAVSGDWLVDNLDAGYGLTGTGSSEAYNSSYTTLDYTVVMGRDPMLNPGAANRLWVRGETTPLGSTNWWQNAYAFQYTTDGSFSVWKVVDGTTVPVQYWAASSAIVQGANWNTLRVKASGGTFSFYINGTLVWSGDDPSLSAGRVGFGFYSIDWVFVDSATLSTTLLPAGEAVVSPAQAAINEAAQRRGGGTIDEAPPR